MAGLDRADLARLPILVGRRAEALGDLFAIGGDGGGDDIVVEGISRRSSGSGPA